MRVCRIGPVVHPGGQIGQRIGVIHVVRQRDPSRVGGVFEHIEAGHIGSRDVIGVIGNGRGPEISWDEIGGAIADIGTCQIAV